MKKFVRKKCPATIGFKSSGQAVLVYCGQWSCKSCAKKLARKWAIRTYRHIEAAIDRTGQRWYFLTLTLGSYYKTASQGFARIKKLWQALRMYLKRKYGAFEYIAFVEGQPRRAGMPHFHIIMSLCPKEALNKKGEIIKHRVHNFAASRGFGFQADLTPVVSKKAAFYVSKYSSKGSEIVPKGFRRVRTSRGWYKLPKQSVLTVPARGEDIAHFILRVVENTGLDFETAYARYAQIMQQFDLATDG